MDIFTKAKRSEVMSRIRSRGNKDTEVALARLLRAHGIVGWRRHVEVRSQKKEVRRKKSEERSQKESGPHFALHTSSFPRPSRFCFSQAQTRGVR
jgi:hypothetical protein